MSFTTYKTDLAGLQKFYGSLIGQFETYAPVEKFGKFDYKKVTGLSGCNPDSPIEKTMSIKPLFFPKSAKVLQYKADSSATEISDTAGDPLAGKRIILGVKHCDARSLQVLDQVYKWDYLDTDYETRRKNTVIISARCRKAGVHCFCTSLDYEIAQSDAMDIAIIETSGGTIYLQPRTEKGTMLLKDNQTGFTTAGADTDTEIREQYRAFEASFRLKMDYPGIHKRMSERFESPVFEAASSSCVSCNTCAFVCPTCHCFKISDEKVRDEGIRYKSYDSCNNVYFTLMAGGHNPRPVKYRRWRQRAMHKFVYYKERFGVNLCVGCGKCAVSCPVNISIFEVVNQVSA